LVQTMNSCPKSIANRGRRANATNGFAVRCANLQAVLNLLHGGQPLSSPEVCEILGLHPSTVARIMASLRAAGLVREVPGPAPSSVGRPPKVWQLNETAGFAIGLSLNPMVLRVVLADLTGHRVATRTFAYDPPLKASEVAQAICHAVEAVTEGVDAVRIYGLGVALSGVVDPTAGVVRMSGGLLRQNGSFVTEYPLADELRELLPWPVCVANDANVGALACFRRMARRGEVSADGSLLYIMAVESLWGFGAGVIIKGRLYTGARGAAGEILHPRLLSYQPDLRELARRAVSGDAAATAEVLEQLRAILEHFAALAMTLDAERVVLGGALAALGEPLQRLMGRLVAESPGFGPYLADLADRAFVLDELWPDTLAVGAAELVLDDLFREPVAGQAGPLVQTVLRHGQSTVAVG